MQFIPLVGKAGARQKDGSRKIEGIFLPVVPRCVTKGTKLNPLPAQAQLGQIRAQPGQVPFIKPARGLQHHQARTVGGEVDLLEAQGPGRNERDDFFARRHAAEGRSGARFNSRRCGVFLSSPIRGDGPGSKRRGKAAASPPDSGVMLNSRTLGRLLAPAPASGSERAVGKRVWTSNR